MEGRGPAVNGGGNLREGAGGERGRRAGAASGGGELGMSSLWGPAWARGEGWLVVMNAGVLAHVGRVLRGVGDCGPCWVGGT